MDYTRAEEATAKHLGIKHGVIIGERLCKVTNSQLASAY